MLTLIIVLSLLWGIYTGVRRGLILQVVYTVGYFISFLVAREYYAVVAEKIDLLVPYPSVEFGKELIFYSEQVSFVLDQAFYNGLAFILLLFAGWLVTRFIGSMLNSLAFFPIIKQLNQLGGGVLGFLMQYIGIFLLLTLASMIPMDFIQQLYVESDLAAWMVSETPYFSRLIYDWWIGNIQ